MKDDWKRIAAIKSQDEGTLAAIWIAYDRIADVIHVYDACVFKREVLAVIAEGLNARGRWIPIAWEKKDKAFSDKLLERGCNMTVEPFEFGDGVAEVIAREMWERMRTGRFKVDKRLSEWKDESKTFYREKQKIPLDSHPLMAATMHAVAMYDEWAMALTLPGAGKLNYPKVAIV